MSGQREAVVEGVARICARFDAAYWRKADETAAFPEEFVRALTDAGYLGIAMPPDVGGAGHMVAGDRNDAFGAGMLDCLARHMPPTCVQTY